MGSASAPMSLGKVGGVVTAVPRSDAKARLTPYLREFTRMTTVRPSRTPAPHAGAARKPERDSAVFRIMPARSLNAPFRPASTSHPYRDLSWLPRSLPYSAPDPFRTRHHP